jgi:uncharacterized protein (TIGR02246 family)
MDPSPLVVGRPRDPGDASRIAAALQEQWEAWNAGSPFQESAFTPDNDYVTFEGAALFGRDVNRRLHERMARGILRRSQISASIRRIRFLTPDIAVVHSVGNLRLRFHKRPKPGRRTIQTTVMRRAADGWAIEAVQNTRIRRHGPLSRLLGAIADAL